MSQQMTQADGESTRRAELLNWKHPDDAPDDALDGRQLVELKKGVRAAIENGDSVLGAPGALNDSEWSHAGVGVSIWMHRSGVVVMSSRGDTLVTDADTLDHIGSATAKFFVTPGPAVVASEDVEE